MEKRVKIDYKNWLRRRRQRVVLPVAIRFGESKFHPGQQWLLVAIDEETGKEKEFSMQNIYSWSPA